MRTRINIGAGLSVKWHTQCRLVHVERETAAAEVWECKELEQSLRCVATESTI